MKKWMYVISVSAMMAVFLVFYFAEKNRTEAREVAKAAEQAEKKRTEDAHQKEIEAKARVDSEKRLAARAADEAKKEADRIARWEEEGRKIQETTDKYNADATADSKKAAELETQLTTLRATKEKLNREIFDLEKQVELGKINRRTAEIEIQRIVEMISRSAANSALARPPGVMAPPPVPSS